MKEFENILHYLMELYKDEGQLSENIFAPEVMYAYFKDRLDIILEEIER